LPSDYQQAEKTFREFLASRGLRFTAARQAVLRAVMNLDGHFGRNRLSARLGGGGAHRATMFRTLPLLVDAGIIRRIRETMDHWHYERVLGSQHHDHLLCVRCGRVVEFTSRAIEREQRRLCRSHGFEEKSHSFIVRGLCASCRRGERRKPTAKGKE
jgi:Fur family ferric uptake transcriptional regulator